MRAKDIEKHRGEEMILQERYEALSRSIQVSKIRLLQCYLTLILVSIVLLGCNVV